VKTAYEKVSTLYRSGRVKRLHKVQTVNEHSIAQHVYGSLIIGVELCEGSRVPVSKEKVMTSLLYHDAAEVDTGDVPAPVKRRSQAISDALMLMEQEFDLEHRIFVELTDAEQKIVKASDALDLAFNCLHEREMGNRTRQIEEVFNTALEYALETNVHGVEYFLNLLRTSWRELA